MDPIEPFEIHNTTPHHTQATLFWNSQYHAHHTTLKLHSTPLPVSI